MGHKVPSQCSINGSSLPVSPCWNQNTYSTALLWEFLLERHELTSYPSQQFKVIVPPTSNLLKQQAYLAWVTPRELYHWKVRFQHDGHVYSCVASLPVNFPSPIKTPTCRAHLQLGQTASTGMGDTRGGGACGLRWDPNYRPSPASLRECVQASLVKGPLWVVPAALIRRLLWLGW